MTWRSEYVFASAARSRDLIRKPENSIVGGKTRSNDGDDEVHHAALDDDDDDDEETTAYSG